MYLWQISSTCDMLTTGQVKTGRGGKREGLQISLAVK